MIAYRVISWLHEHIPPQMLRLWDLSDTLRSWTRKVAYGGDEYKEWYSLYKEMERWPEENIRAFQTRLLRRLISHCYTNVSYYTELLDKLGLKPEDFDSPEDLKKLPVLTKKDVLAHYPKFFAKNMSRLSAIPLKTTGTSGRAVTFYRDRSIIAAGMGAQWYLREIMGHQLGKDFILFAPGTGKPGHLLLTRTEPPYSPYSPLTRGVYFPTHLISDETFKRYVHYIRKFNIEHIEGMPSIIVPFARYIAKKNIPIKIKSFISVCEVLHPLQRESIEKAFDCEVFDYYAAVDNNLAAWECEKHHGMNVLPHHLLENSVKPKEKGVIISTNLAGYFMPLLRYSTGDVASILRTRCPCGRPYPRIISIEGRSNDVIFLKDGKRIHPGKLAWYPAKIKGIYDLQFIQKKDYSVLIMIVKGPSQSSASIKEKVCREFAKDSHGALRFRTSFVSAIERKGKKYRVVESHVRKELDKAR